ncbi:AMP-binding protein [Streptomyces malaysiensis]|uniref:AMP-binding protein n=1 Tax=Streptomyces malaysiensis TaxID=92644 RepID=UPI0032E35BE7
MITAATQVFRDARDQVLSLRGDYERAIEDFRWPEFEASFNWAVDWFDAIAEGNHRSALVIVEEDGSSSSLSFEEIFRRSNQVAAWLMQQGVQKGDSVVLMLGNQVELWDCMLGLMKLGAVVMPTAAAISGADLADRITRADVKFVICNPSDTVKFDDAPGDYIRISVRDVQGWRPLADAYRLPDDVRVPHPETAPADRLLLYFTSGTTSRPKLVEHTQVSYPVGHLSTLYYLGLRPGDVHLNISSPGWAKHAWSSFFTPWIAEATVFVYNYARFDAKALLEQIRTHGVTTFCAPPTVWRMLINADLSGGRGSLREVIGAGEPLNPEVIDQVRKHWGLEIRDGYGQTETTAQIGNPPGIPIKIGSMGRPLPGVPVVLVDPATGTRVAGTGEGEICLDLAQHPVNFMRGYLDDEARNVEATHGGLYHTGDVATVDERGYITFVGRTDDVFKASDYKISPFEVESVLVEHPAVLEAAVVPAPDPVRLAVPKAYIALAPGHEASDDTALSILRYAREHLAPYQRVRRIEFIELPKTISGKIRRVELRMRELEIAESPRSSKQEWWDTDFPNLRRALPS